MKLKLPAVSLKRLDFPRYMPLCAAIAGTFCAAGAFDAAAIRIPQSAIELNAARNYRGVLDVFDRLRTEGETIDNPDREQADLMFAEALFYTSAPGAREALEAFAETYPSSPSYSSVVLMIGDCLFAEGDYSSALMWFDSVDLSRVPLTADSRYYFMCRVAVARLMNGIADSQTDALLRGLKEAPDYRLRAEYYEAYSQYLREDYDTAFKGFESVAKRLADSGVGTDGMAPQYYMIQILYKRGRFDEVINRGMTQLRKNPVPELLPELHRVIGLSHFKQGNFHSALGHLDSYDEEARRRGFVPSAEAVYALGVCEYEDGDPGRASMHLSSLTDLHDIVGQGAWYHLGEIAMAEGRYDEAVIDFSKAARLAFDSDTSERASYNCIAAVTHGGRSPFGSTTAMYEDFLSQWPESHYADNVRKGLYQAYAASKDYDNALLILDGIRRPDSGVKAERQKLLYAKGTQLERAGRHKDAAAVLDEAVRIGADRDVTAEAAVWLGAAQYGAGDYAASVKALDKALASSAVGGDRKAEALYQRAYSNMRREKYSDAARDFSALLRDGSVPRSISDDARLRLADCQYYTGNLAAASETYRNAREKDAENADYATLRIALMAGLQGDRKKEAALLRDFIRDYPGSPSRPEALFRLGASLAAMNQTQEAVSVFRQLIEDSPTSDYAREGALKAARLLAESGDRTGAVAGYREIIKMWPGSEEAADADNFLRDYYGGTGELEEYARFLSSISGAPQIRPDQMEEITFRSAERAYIADPNDTAPLKKYLEKYPDGSYLAQALLWIVSSDAEAGRGVQALDAIGRLQKLRPGSPEAEEALLLKEELKDYSDLIEAIELADNPRKTSQGLDKLKALSANPETPAGAQAAVELGERLLKAGKNSEALEVLEEFTSSGTGHHYWLARGFLALADVHHAMGKDWLAKEYVVSLRDNYPGDESDITEGIARRLKQYQTPASPSGDKTGSKRKSRKRK